MSPSPSPARTQASDQSPDRPPLALTDFQLAIVAAAASPLHPRDRRAFLEVVASMLDGRELGDGLVARVAREAQRRFWRGAELGDD
jgi:hypothetical protein